MPESDLAPYIKRPHLVDIVAVHPLDTSFATKRCALEFESGALIQISESLFNIARYMDGAKTVDEIAELVCRQEGQKISGADVIKICEHFLIPNNMLQLPGARSNAKPQRKKSILFPIPILPPFVVRAATRPLSKLFAPRLMVKLGILSIVAQAVFYVYVWLCAPTDLAHSVPAGILLFPFGLLRLVIHELGHTAACAYFNLTCDKIGIGFYKIFPVGYSDVHRAWLLNRKQRVIVDIGGIYLEGLLMILTILVCLVFRQWWLGYLINAGNMGVIFNLCPMFRMDGYWMLADTLGIPNMSQRIYLLWRQLGAKLLHRHRLDLLNEFSTPVRYGFLAYAISSALFSALFMGTYSLYFKHTLHSLPGRLMDGWANLVLVTQGSQIGQFVIGVLQLLSILFPLLVLVLITYTVINRVSLVFLKGRFEQS